MHEHIRRFLIRPSIENYLSNNQEHLLKSFFSSTTRIVLGENDELVDIRVY